MRPTLTIADIYATPACAPMLRVLELSSAPGSTRRLARDAHISHTAASAVLQHFEYLGLVRCSVVGRAHVYSLIRSNIYVRDMILPAVDAERAVITELRRDLTEEFSEGTISLILFGSYAYGEQHPLSDIDVFALVETALDKQRLEEREMACGVELLDKYGSPLSLMVYTREHAAEALADGKSSFTFELETTGIILHGLGVDEWGIDGQEEAGTEGVGG
jgi:predicted nucleotidyltransferase